MQQEAGRRCGGWNTAPVRSLQVWNVGLVVFVWALDCVATSTSGWQPQPAAEGRDDVKSWQDVSQGNVGAASDSVRERSKDHFVSLKDRKGDRRREFQIPVLGWEQDAVANPQVENVSLRGHGVRRQLIGGQEMIVGENEWVRNGIKFGAGMIPTDEKFWNNRRQLYDNFGNYKYGEEYFAEGSVRGTGNALGGLDLLVPYEDRDTVGIINDNTVANFWSGRDLPGGGFSLSYPERPWIRQSMPFTCETNPWDECPTPADRARCIANGCGRGKKVRTTAPAFPTHSTFTLLHANRLDRSI